MTDAVETMQQAIAAAVQLADDAIKRGDEESLSAALDRLRRVQKDADALRKREKEPHMAAARAVDQKWKPLIDVASGALAKVRAALTEVRRRIAEERRREAERMRQEAELRAAIAAESESDIAAEIERKRAEEIARAAKRVEKAPKRMRRVLRVDVVDLVEAVRHLARDNAAAQELADVVAKHARRLHQRGVEVPGVSYRHEEVAI